MKSKGARLWERAKKIIPGGNQLLSKRAEMFLPGYWPAYYKKARGVQVWGLDGERYLDFCIMGIGTCILGYANPAVNRAVKKAVSAASMCTLNCHEEVELAEALIRLHPWADRVRFARTGGEACAVAVRIARAASGRDKVAFCGYHGWHDWYLCANLADSRNLDGLLLPGLDPAGVPRALREHSLPFAYGNFAQWREIVKNHGRELGAVIMEVQRDKEIDLPFHHEILKTARRLKVPVIYDEVTSGFRLRPGGLHMLYGLKPDIVVLGKAMGNGFPIAAIVGRREVMQAAQSTFISSTYWTERIGYAASLEVIRQFEKEGAAQKLDRAGQCLRHGLSGVFQSRGLAFEVGGLVPITKIAIREKDPLLVKTLFTQEMLQKGFLASNLIYLSIAHSPPMIGKYLKAVDELSIRLKKIIEAGQVKKKLRGAVCHAGFHRLN